MNRHLTVKQYMIIDLVIFSVLLCILEIASRMALNFFQREIFTISIVLPLVLIAMMRHGVRALPLAALGGLVYCALNGAQAKVYLVYMLGNSVIAANLFWFKKVGKDKIRENTWIIVLYVASGYILMNLGRSVFAFLLGYEKLIANMVRYFTTDALSAVMAVVIILVARRQDGVFEDQMDYLIRQAEKEEEKDAK